LTENSEITAEQIKDMQRNRNLMSFGGAPSKYNKVLPYHLSSQQDLNETDINILDKTQDLTEPSAS
jgi:hypothetical protein